MSGVYAIYVVVVRWKNGEPEVCVSCVWCGKNGDSGPKKNYAVCGSSYSRELTEIQTVLSTLVVIGAVI